MSCTIWAGGQALDLGDAFDVVRGAGEIAQAALVAGDAERWEYLASVLDQLEQDAGAEWLGKAQVEAKEFLRLHGGEVGRDGRRLLSDLVAGARPDTVSGAAPEGGGGPVPGVAAVGKSLPGAGGKAIQKAKDKDGHEFCYDDEKGAWARVPCPGAGEEGAPEPPGEHGAAVGAAPVPLTWAALVAKVKQGGTATAFTAEEIQALPGVLKGKTSYQVQRILEKLLGVKDLNVPSYKNAKQYAIQGIIEFAKEHAKQAAGAQAASAQQAQAPPGTTAPAAQPTTELKPPAQAPKTQVQPGGAKPQPEQQGGYFAAGAKVHPKEDLFKPHPGMEGLAHDPFAKAGEEVTVNDVWPSGAVGVVNAKGEAFTFYPGQFQEFKPGQLPTPTPPSAAQPEPTQEQQAEPASPEVLEGAVKWVASWTWGSYGGVPDKMPPPEVAEYLQQFKPDGPVTLYRFEREDHDPAKAFNTSKGAPLQSWTHNKQVAQEIAEDKTAEGTPYKLVTKTFNPEDVFADTTKFPKELLDKFAEMKDDPESGEEVLVFVKGDEAPQEQPTAETPQGQQGEQPPAEQAKGSIKTALLNAFPQNQSDEAVDDFIAKVEANGDLEEYGGMAPEEIAAQFQDYTNTGGWSEEAAGDQTAAGGAPQEQQDEMSPASTYTMDYINAHGEAPKVTPANPDGSFSGVSDLNDSMTHGGMSLQEAANAWGYTGTVFDEGGGQHWFVSGKETSEGNYGPSKDLNDETQNTLQQMADQGFDYGHVSMYAANHGFTGEVTDPDTGATWQFKDGEPAKPPGAEAAEAPMVPDEALGQWLGDEGVSEGGQGESSPEQQEYEKDQEVITDLQTKLLNGHTVPESLDQQQVDKLDEALDLMGPDEIAQVAHNLFGGYPLTDAADPEAAGEDYKAKISLYLKGFGYEGGTSIHPPHGMGAEGLSPGGTPPGTANVAAEEAPTATQQADDLLQGAMNEYATANPEDVDAVALMNGYTGPVVMPGGDTKYYKDGEPVSPAEALGVVTGDDLKGYAEAHGVSPSQAAMKLKFTGEFTTEDPTTAWMFENGEYAGAKEVPGAGVDPEAVKKKLYDGSTMTDAEASVVPQVLADMDLNALLHYAEEFGIEVESIIEVYHENPHDALVKEIIEDAGTSHIKVHLDLDATEEEKFLEYVGENNKWKDFLGKSTEQMTQAYQQWKQQSEEQPELGGMLANLNKPEAPPLTWESLLAKVKKDKGGTAFTAAEVQQLPKILQGKTSYQVGRILKKLLGALPDVPPVSTQKEKYIADILDFAKAHQAAATLGVPTPQPPSVAPKVQPAPTKKELTYEEQLAVMNKLTAGDKLTDLEKEHVDQVLGAMDLYPLLQASQMLFGIGKTDQIYNEPDAKNNLKKAIKKAVLGQQQPAPANTSVEEYQAEIVSKLDPYLGESGLNKRFLASLGTDQKVLKSYASKSALELAVTYKHWKDTGALPHQTAVIDNAVSQAAAGDLPPHEASAKSVQVYKKQNPHGLGSAWGPKAAGKKVAYGGVVFNGQGQILLREPANHYDNYVWTFPKGTPEGADHPAETAAREVLEESGQYGVIEGYLPGKHESGSSANYYYLMKAAGEDKSKMDWETASTKWVDLDEAAALIGLTTNAAGKKRDLGVLAQLQYLQKQKESFTGKFTDALGNEVWFQGGQKVDAPAKGSPDEKAAALVGQFGEQIEQYAKSDGTQGLVVKVPQAGEVGKDLLDAGFHWSSSKGAFTVPVADDLDKLSAVLQKHKPKPPPPLPEGMSFVKNLGGSTGAQQWKDAAGNLYVKKKGNNVGHLLEEHHADQAYAAAGLAVPQAALYTDKDGSPAKLASWLDGQTSDKYFKRLGEQWAKDEISEKEMKARKQQVFDQLKQGFVMDCLLGNWDVVGQNFDNILIDKQGKVWRIDNGGSLRYRAQGALKKTEDWGPEVKEIKSLLDPSYNPQTAQAFKGITPQEIAKQINELYAKKDAILKAVPESVRDTLGKRFDWAKETYGEVLTEGTLKHSLYEVVPGEHWAGPTPQPGAGWVPSPSESKHPSLKTDYADDEPRLPITPAQWGSLWADHDKRFKALPKAQRAALHLWTAAGGDYKKWSEAIRKCPQTLDCEEMKPWKAKTEAALKAMAALGKMGQPVMVWRGFTPTDLAGRDISAKFFQYAQYNMDKGSTVRIPAFKSGSLNPKKAWPSPILLEVKSRTGVLMHTNSKCPSEEEFLMNHLSEYKVVGIKNIKIQTGKKDNGEPTYRVRKTIQLEEV